MSLPTCEDVGGEESNPHGFCPIELWVPRFRKIFRRNKRSGEQDETWLFETEAAEEAIAKLSFPEDEVEVGPWRSLDTGFVAGCLWGDDSSWKVEVIDLTMVSAGQLSRSARFGHLQLARGMSLSDSLSFDRYMPYWELRTTIIRQERRDVASGELINPYDE